MLRVLLRERVEHALARWQTDPDLAALRNPDELQSLPPGERELFLAFWKAVDAEITTIKNMS